MTRKQQFICEHCGRRVYAEGGPLALVKLCRSCFEKARKAQLEAERKAPEASP